jgi:hypothetical protein
MVPDKGPPSSGGGRPPYLSPWSLLLGGLLLTFLGVALAAVGGPLPRLLGLGGGLLLAAVAVSRRLRSAGWEFEQRLESAGVLALAGLTALLASFGLDKDWDSGRLVLGVLTALCLAGSLLVLLPAAPRRLAVSLVVAFHFAGILVAVTTVDPPGTQGPWLAKQLYVRVYQPYLEFLYLTNAYHFYSPNPGLPSQMRFAVHYSDGRYAWVNLPDRANSPVDMHYQRMLTLPEHIFAPMPRLPLTKAELAHLSDVPGLARESWEEIQERRLRGSTLAYSPPIPVVLDLDATFQYRAPNDLSKRMIASAARRVFRDAPPRQGAEVTSVKVYRATHTILTPYEMSKGVSQLDKSKFLPYFLGEFDGRGELLDPHEPFLYWYLPVLYVSPEYPLGYPGPRPGLSAVRALLPPPSPAALLDCLEAHAAGTTRKPANQGSGQ